MKKETKNCSYCFKKRPISEFYRRGDKQGGLKSRCKKCCYETYGLPRNKALKEKVFSHYGKKCSCCGETEYDFLTIDHINNDGFSDRKRNIKIGFYSSVIQRKYPKDLQVLCFNCNLGKRIAGICPHQKKRIIARIEKINKILSPSPKH